MKIKDILGIAALSTPEKIILLEDLWDSIASTEDIPVAGFHKIELDKRYEKHGEHPVKTLSLDELKVRINHKK